MRVDAPHSAACRGEQPSDVGYPSRDQCRRLILHLEIGLERRIDLLVYALGLSADLELELFAIRKSIHCRGSSVCIIRHCIPPRSDMRSFVEPTLLKKTWCEATSTLRRSGPAPFPINFAVLEVRRDGVLSRFVIRLDCMGDDDLAG